jgi:hypothetical protein
VSGSIDKIVHVDDGVCGSIELLPILAKERMRELLSDELVRRGFERDGNVARRATGDGVTVEVDLDSGTVTARAEADVHVDIKGQVDGPRRYRESEGNSPENREIERAALQAELEATLAAREAKETKLARRATTERLEASLRDLKRELDAATNRVTAEALKEKAKSMGEIEELVEDAETGALTIKVKL